jgi:hypothetical protein
MRRRPGHLLVQPPSHRCKQRRPGNGSARNHAFSVRPCSWASS